MLGVVVLCKVGLTCKCAVTVWVMAGKVDHGWWIIASTRECHVELKSRVKLIRNSIKIVKSYGKLWSIRE